MNKTTIPEVAAGMLSTTICDFITCEPESSEFLTSEKWLNDKSESFLTFTFCCQTLGIDAIELKKSVIAAQDIRDFPSVPYLYLVQSPELCDNVNYETDFNSHRTSETEESER